MSTLGATASVIELAYGQTASDILARKTQATAKKGDDKLLVESRELVYDRDNDTVAASGNAQLYYQGRVLEADKVTYDRKANRVYASGNAKLTEADGQVFYADRFELTDDFKDGFIDSLRIETTDRTRFAAPRAERTAGETTVFEKGTYTACEPCKDDPSKPPTWQVRAKRIIHKNEEQTVYYEDATLEFWGMPVAWFPYFSAPDTTVKRKSGFLAPHYIASTALGYGVSIPYFWAIAPNYDLTITPTFLTRQGVLGQAEWRHRLVNGSYNIRAAGIFQQDRSAFLQPPFGAGDKTFRGSVDTAGNFVINDKWQWGWDIHAASDKWFNQNYKYNVTNITDFNWTGFRESVSTMFLRGQGERSFFDARGYYFRGLSYADWQKQLPVAAPVVDYDRRFTGPGVLGGELTIGGNITTITREQTAYQSLVNAAGQPGNYQVKVDGKATYDTCAPGFYNPTDCFVRGVAGTYSRGSVDVAWRRTFIDPLGQTWTPFASMRGDVAFPALSTTGQYNQYLPLFIDTSGEVIGRFMPAVGGTYRYPFVAQTDFGTHIVEPIAQLIARPNETQIGRMPNEDAQSLVFDDTTLFSVNKFSGYDRIEGGTRANVGAQYTYNGPNGGFGSFLFGQSYQVAGLNSYANPDLARTGLDSGLSDARSSYVSRIQMSPFGNINFIARGRFSQEDFALQRLELQAVGTYDRLTASILYARYAPQPELGLYTTREGFVTQAKLAVTPNIYVSGGVAVDLGRQDAEKFYNPGGQISNAISISAVTVGAGYTDDCTTLGIIYSNSAKQTYSEGTKDRVQTVMLRLELRTLGAAGYSFTPSIGATDGVNQ
ncbi:LPS-assembly protein LptD [Alsobacter sp. SYSU M60028]|uniref:LPS-assembly protein LptD n=1 Tax=Alsobacter ponti TaxID=2962936 RepID=A0ABT1LHV0_9HYPH|nr:LPS-assembly protein LptD [Alsobacter ponti]MCP8940265.1 LPS-assembly protein LptD [Alsobacter ponti]